MTDVPAASTYKVAGWNVEVQGFDAKVVKTVEDWKSQRKRRQGLTFETRVKNLVVNVCVDLISSRLLSNTDNFISHCGVGSDATAAAASQTDLIVAIGARHAITSAYPVSLGQSHWDTFYLTTENNGVWAEVALFNDATVGIMFARVVLGTTFLKSGSNTASVNWTSTCTAVP